MKLKYKLIVLPCISSLLLTVIFFGLVIVQKSWISEGMSADEAWNSLLYWSLAVSVAVLLVTILLAWRMAGKLTDSLVTISAIAWDIANGDLSPAVEAARTLMRDGDRVQHADSQDETRRLLTAIAAMTENLDSLVGQVRRSGAQVAASSTDLFTTAQQQETMVTHQMQSMDKVHTSIAEISDISTHLADTMQQVAAASQDTADFASSGQADVLRMKDAMSRMKQASQLISDRLETINENAENITTIVTTITKVADKTNLLSLNAAIEAEKSGEYGHGFTVIAREIRRLADQTALATVDIERMVQAMQSSVVSGVMEMDKFVTEVRHGVQDVSRISNQLTKIIEQVQALSPNFEHVNDAMGHQLQNARNIAVTIAHLSNDTQQTMAALRESYAAIAQMNTAVQDLQKEVSRFQVSSSILNEIEIFQPFSNEAITYLREHMQGHHFSPGNAIVCQGDLTDSLYIIAKGVVGITVQLPDGSSLEVARKAAGDIFGEISLLTGEPRTATVTAITDAYLFEMRKKDIAPFISAEPAIAERLSAILTERKLDTETKKKLHTSHKEDREAMYSQTLDKIQQFFRLNRS